MKNPRMSEAMFAIANKFTLAEEATLDTSEQKKEQESGHADQPSSSKGHDNKRKADRSINVVAPRPAFIQKRRKISREQGKLY
jgi:hypothetical protein